MNLDQPTPRTDAVMEGVPLQRPSLSELADFARNLERENAALREALIAFMTYADLDEDRYPHAKRFNNSQGAVVVSKARATLAATEETK